MFTGPWQLLKTYILPCTIGGFASFQGIPILKYPEAFVELDWFSEENSC